MNAKTVMLDSAVKLAILPEIQLRLENVVDRVTESVLMRP